MRHPVLPLLLSLIATLACASALAQSSAWSGTRGQAITPCSQFASLSGTIPSLPGATNGIFGVPQVGETYTIAVTGPGTGTFRIVGDPSGTITYAGPTTVPGTLTFTVTGAPPPTAAGVGYFFDAGTGTVTLGATCGAFSVPAGNFPGVALLVGLTALVAIAALFRRRKATA